MHYVALTQDSFEDRQAVDLINQISAAGEPGQFLVMSADGMQQRLYTKHASGSIEYTYEETPA